jgi:TusA-related sulfurtransferase
MTKETSMRTSIQLALLLFTTGAAAQTGAPGPNHMIHCPNAVEGAKTTIKNTKDGVELQVTAKDENAVQEIRKRAAHLAEVSEKPDTGKDTGGGDFGGGKGHCPVVMKDTVVTAKDVKGGSKISVKAEKGKADAKTLQKEAKERLLALKTATPKAPEEKKPAPPKKPEAEKKPEGGGW